MTKHSASTALLGLLALSGYNNQDQISDVWGRLKARFDGDGVSDRALPDIDEAFLQNLKTWFGEVDLASTLDGAMTELDDIFAARGYSARTNAWFGDGPNATIGRDELADALGEDLLVQLSQKTGLTRDDILFRLTDALPKAVAGLSGPAQTVAARRD